MRSQLCDTTICLALVILSCGFGAEVADKNGTQWSPYLEWAFQNTSWHGSAFDVKASATFVHQNSGLEHITELFYHGETQWTLRFAGTRIGLWTFTTSSDDPDLDGHGGTLTIHPNAAHDAHGFLQGCATKWGWQGTKSVFVPQLVMWDYLVADSSPGFFYRQPRLVDAKIRAFIDGHGFTGFHVSVIGGRWFDMEAETDRVARHDRARPSNLRGPGTDHQ